MIYLAIDTDVWLHLATYGFDKEHNPFDELCYWLELGEVSCIVPQHIITEWERHKDIKVDSIKTAMAKSVGQIRTVMQNHKIFDQVFNSDNFEATSRARVARVAEVFERYAIIAPVTDLIQLEAGSRTLQRLAPSHKKDSYSDAVNILAIYYYVRDHQLSPVIFTSKNFKDYSAIEDEKLLHPELRPFFDEIGLKYEPNVDHLFGKILRPALPPFATYLTRRKEDGQRALQRAAQQEREQLSNADEDYIGNVSMMEQVLQQAKPTQFQYKMIRELIDSDPDCRKYFFEHVDKPVWLSFIEENGFLDPLQHPGPVITTQGTYVANWQCLGFLERLSKQVKAGNYPELISVLLKHIENISSASIDNEFTHTALIRILSDLPTKFITDTVLDHLPKWFSVNTNKMFPTSAVCELLLPKFINDQACDEDIAKGEKILSYMLGISSEGFDTDKPADRPAASFYSNSYTWVLAETLIKKELILVVARRCSRFLFLELARTVKLLIWDHPKVLHIQLKHGDKVSEVKIEADLSQLIFSTSAGQDTILATGKIAGFKGMTDEELKTNILIALTNLDLNYDSSPENEDQLRGLIFSLTVDNLSMSGGAAISELDIDRSYNKHFRSLYAIILMKYLSAISDQRPDTALVLSRMLFYDPLYRLPLFRRIIFHNLSLHFVTQRVLLKELFAPNDPERIFDKYIYRVDLFNLLQSIQHFVNAEEIELLNKIITEGPAKKDEMDAGRIAYWQFRWCLALNQIEPFAFEYKRLGQQFDLQDHDGNPNEMLRFRSGRITPISVEQLLAKSNKQILTYINNFKVTDRWEGPNIEGLAETFKQAVAQKPERFTASLDIFLALPYIYTYHLLYTLLEVERKPGTDLNWKAVINFCKDYVLQQDFDSEKRQLQQDNWHADKNWVMGVIAYLLSDLCRLDEIVEREELVPVCEATLLAMDVHLSISATEEPQHRDYITHSYNSDNGKFLRACMDHCLCKNRLTSKDDPIFDPRFITIFNSYLSGHSIDAFTIIGYYWQQFNYLGHSWLLSQITSVNNTYAACWQAFMGGFLFAPTPGTNELLDVVMPYYAKAIDEKINIKVTGTNGFALHMATLYFWGVLDLSEKSILTKYLTSMPIVSVRDLLHIMFFSSTYFGSLDDSEHLAAEKKVIELVGFLKERYQISDDPEIIEMLRFTVNLVYMVRVLNEENTSVICHAIKIATKQYHHDDLIEPLHKLIASGSHIDTARHLAVILDQMTFQDQMHLMENDRSYLGEIIQFLYNNECKKTADKLCNRLMRAGQIFAKGIFQRNIA